MPASNVWPTLATPIPVPEPATPYDEVMIWFSMAPRTDGDRIDVTFSITMRPYRRLVDGTLLLAPDNMTTSYTVGSARDLKSENRPAAMKCAKDVMSAIQTYVASI